MYTAMSTTESLSKLQAEMQQAKESQNFVEFAVKAMLISMGENPDREGLLDTPKRVGRMWKELTAGYHQSPREILETGFTEGVCDQMVALTNIQGWSTCEHHLLPFSYTAHVGYIPSNMIVGISKLARLVECHGRRLQIQERMTDNIADDINTYLHPKGVIVVIEGHHLCMTVRGVKQTNTMMRTSAIRGVFNDAASRAEFFSLIRG